MTSFINSLSPWICTAASRSISYKDSPSPAIALDKRQPKLVQVLDLTGVAPYDLSSPSPSPIRRMYVTDGKSNAEVFLTPDCAKKLETSLLEMQDGKEEVR